MDELHDAIEDAQYLNAIDSVDAGLQPVLPWPVPSEEELAEWKETVEEREGVMAFTAEWILSSPLGFFLFAEFLKTSCNDYLRINFMESVIKYKRIRPPKRSKYARRIAVQYLMPVDDSPPEKKDIESTDIYRGNTKISKEVIAKLCEESTDETCAECCVGLKGESLKNTVEKACRKPMGNSTESVMTSLKYLSFYPDDLFDNMEAVVLENLKKQYWSSFLESNEYGRLLSFLWYQDKPVVEDDFLCMRVLGRGGFGLVTACKKVTSGKLYAMKTMSKKRIKIKKAEQLTVNERRALEVVGSKFVISLKYAFQSKDDIYLILDLMTGGDLNFHLQQKGMFSKEESIYYAARIMLGLQAMHDRHLVYRDLKPENCLLDEDGRVRITDLGLAISVSPNLIGAAGTRGYWAPEMLARDSEGQRIPYDHAVDWFSFGCLLVEFISGRNPFRTEEALQFGLDSGCDSKDKAIDYATMNMDPTFHPSKFDDDAADLCRKLLDKDASTRLGTNGAEEIMLHPWFKGLDWDLVISDKMDPPFIPPKDVNAHSQSDIGTFVEDKVFQQTRLDEKDNEYYKDWDWINPTAYHAEVIEYLIYERDSGAPLVPAAASTCCCTVS